MAAVQQKYAEEAAKRLRPDGLAQFVELKDSDSERFRALDRDPWADHAALNAQDPAPLKDGAQYKFVILGAGYGGLLFAVRLIQAGVATGPDDIRIIDTAGGFGGTWYWNRYPGLHCDVESYAYMPLLEETGYMPKYKYSPGPELLEHANRIATQWHLHDKAAFRTSIKNSSWEDTTNTWSLKATQDRGPDEKPIDLHFSSQYVLIASGVLTKPQIPRISGLDSFSGPITHSARWDYSITGGSPEKPDLTGLADKRVGIVGTGATAIQAVPRLAKWAKELYVFQRTPSAIHHRGQRPTDPDGWKTKIASKKGWQLERNLNFSSYLENAPDPAKENAVGDDWTKMPAFSAVIGGPGIVEPIPEKISAHVQKLYALDAPRREAVHARVDSIVSNPETAAKLKAWYPVWCKRPTFSDEYLQTFNQPNVHLVDTDGKGLSGANSNGLIVDGTEYPLDVLILCTGFRTPAEGNGSPAVRTGVEIRGREGRSLDEKWQGHGVATLHGTTSNGFPNLFFTGNIQGGAAPNYAFFLDVISAHVAQVVAAAESRAERGTRPVIEVTSPAEEAWSMECARRAAWFSGIIGCTPGYITSEGRRPQSQDPESMLKLSRASPWAEGITSYINTLKRWSADGQLDGLEIKNVPVV